ncbi:cobalamin-dependent protein [[Eubacterium] cellulosolvens]
MSQKTKMTIVIGSLGEDVHVAGTWGFANIAKKEGYNVVLLGPAVSVKEFIGAIIETDANIIGISYRLSPESAKFHLLNLKNGLQEAGLLNRRYFFGGTPPAAMVARSIGIFERVFDGTEQIEEVLSVLRGYKKKNDNEIPPQKLIERINWKSPYPILRHHFGLPYLEDTINGIKEIAESRVLDVISLAIDQDAQEHFFYPEKQKKGRAGAGGTPIRSEDDLSACYKASRCGNYPMMRCYAGTNDLIRFAEVLNRTIHNTWAAIPLFWFNQMDGRGPMDLDESIKIHQEAMRWHGQRNIPVEVNEPHHWEMRSAPDTVSIAAAFLSAWNAKKMGVKYYISIHMFNHPPGENFQGDLAKQMAKLQLIEPLQDETFSILRQTRTGLLSYPTDLDEAKGQLASSLMLQMALNPQIIHVVAFCEADHAAGPEDIIQSCKITRRVIKNCLDGIPDMTKDPVVIEKSKRIAEESTIILQAIKKIAKPNVEDPWSDAATLTQAVALGIMDAPQLLNEKYARGEVSTEIIDGVCQAIDPKTGKIFNEKDRISRIFEKIKAQ